MQPPTAGGLQKTKSHTKKKSPSLMHSDPKSSIYGGGFYLYMSGPSPKLGCPGKEVNGSMGYFTYTYK